MKSNIFPISLLPSARFVKLPPCFCISGTVKPLVHRTGPTPLLCAVEWRYTKKFNHMQKHNFRILTQDKLILVAAETTIWGSRHHHTLKLRSVESSVCDGWKLAFSQRFNQPPLMLIPDQQKYGVPMATYCTHRLL